MLDSWIPSKKSDRIVAVLALRIFGNKVEAAGIEPALSLVESMTYMGAVTGL